MSEAPTKDLATMLRAGGAERDEACLQLRSLLLRAALSYLTRQRYSLESFGADSYESLAEDFAQESLTVILSQIETFRGDSRFTTWAYRIVINLIADEYRRRAWRRRPLAPGLDDAVERSVSLPESVAQRSSFLLVIEDVIRQELTPRQRHALVGKVFEEKPLIVLADELNTSKDGVYKLIHDARKHLKRSLNARGITEADVLSTFSEE